MWEMSELSMVGENEIENEDWRPYQKIVNLIHMYENGELEIDERKASPKTVYTILMNTLNLIRLLTDDENQLSLTNNELKKFPNYDIIETIDPIPEKESMNNSSKTDPYTLLLNSMDLEKDSFQELSIYQMTQKIDEISNRITREFNKNWRQTYIRFKLEIIGDNITLRILEDNDAETSTLPSDRSQGFRWFLSFFCHLISREDSELENTVILLDDPGAYLHPEGHKDLKKALTEIGKSNQVIYNTHSPYLINKDRLNSVRIVKHNRDEPDDEDERIGTNISRLGKADSPTDDSLAAVRMALGATSGDSLFISGNSVLVEGHDDRIYLEAMSDLLGQLNKTTLDEKANIVDCGGATKVDYLARIADSEGHNFAVLLDDDDAGSHAKNELERSEIESGHVHLVSSFMDELEEGESRTIEDMFSVDLFCEVTAEVHNHDGLSKDELKSAYRTPGDGIVSALDGRLKGERGIGQDSEFYDDEEDGLDSGPAVLKKVKIARRIDNGIASGEFDEDKFEDSTLNRFEELIQAINASLAEDSEGDEEKEEVAADD